MEIRTAPRFTTKYEVITLSDKDIENTVCFACSACNRCSAGQTAISLESRKYCWRCFEKAFGQKCLLCQKPISGESQITFIYYNNQVWHKDCFKRYTPLG